MKRARIYMHENVKVHAPKQLPDSSGAGVADLVLIQLKFLEGGVAPVKMPMPANNAERDDQSRAKCATPQNMTNGESKAAPPKMS